MIKNYHVYNRDQEKLKTLQEEYINLGRDCKLIPGRLTVFAKARKSPLKLKT